jgi:hypothetical protein
LSEDRFSRLCNSGPFFGISREKRVYRVSGITNRGSTDRRMTITETREAAKFIFDSQVKMSRFTEIAVGSFNISLASTLPGNRVTSGSVVPRTGFIAVTGFASLSREVKMIWSTFLASLAFDTWFAHALSLTVAL